MRRLPIPDQLISSQHGAISRSQALQAGLSPDQIDRLLAARRWLRALRGVYVVAGSPDTWQRRAMAACLAGPTGTVASYLTAAALFGLGKPPNVPHVTVPSRASGRFGRASVHWAALSPQDVCFVGEIPSTTPARTLVDCATILEFNALCELVDPAICRELTDPSRLRAAAGRASRGPGRKGLPLLEEVLLVWAGPRPGSPAEMRLLRRLIGWGFPQPERQVVITDEQGAFLGRIDLGWADHRFGFEYDGAEFHTPRQWESDEARQYAIEAMGWRIERVDKFDLRPSSTRLRELLAPIFVRVQGRAA